MPRLNAAQAALDILKPADITVVKTMQNPPGLVKLVMESICVMMGVKPERKPDPGGSGKAFFLCKTLFSVRFVRLIAQNVCVTGKMIEDFWGPSKKLLGELKFLENLKAYDKDNIPAPYIKKIREKFINNPEFQPAVIKNVSSACEGLCKWVREMEVYDNIIKVVAPKKEKLKLAEEQLRQQRNTLNEQIVKVKELENELQSLNVELEAKIHKKEELEDNIKMCSQKLIRAEKLIGGLGGEKDRWTEAARQLEMRYIQIYYKWHGLYLVASYA